jgi:hypothetical protein
MSLKTLVVKGALAAVAAGGVIISTATPAAADIACNRYGECWHVRDRTVVYPPTLGIQFYDDDWARHHRHGYHWRHDRDNDDRGYYAHGRWHPVNDPDRR